jgi:probable selenium-dependent hydroxylase accessory protein YqeC
VPLTLVEAPGTVAADGACPFKASAAHEPVISPDTTLVVSVVSADIFGKSLDAAHVYRPKLVSGLSGAPLELVPASARGSRPVLASPAR